MSQYYDKDKFRGDAPPSRPPRGGEEDWSWLKWPVVIFLFSLSPVLGFLGLAFFSKYKKRKHAERRKREAQERIARAMSEAEQRMSRAREQTAQADAAHRTAAREVMDRRRGQSQSYTEPVQQKEARAPSEQKQKAKGNKTARLLRIIGISLLAMGAVLCLDGIPTLIQGNLQALEDIFLSAGFMVSGGLLWGRGEYLENMSRRTQRYILAIGAAETMRIDEIAKRVNRSADKTVRELQKLIDKGYLGEDAYIDYEKGIFARFGAVVDEKPMDSEVPKEAEEGYSGLLRNLRTANDRIPDAELSAKIERLEQISALIFKEVEEHPEKRSRIHTFFDYYLPTTQKLLDTYAEFDEMGVEGENVSQAKERIKEMMDSIVEGFEYQLDQLYSADAMEVVSDIKVMETMLNRDTASAAKDFGYDKAKKPEEQEERKLQQLEL